jgi:hypothetical protein
MRIDSHQVMATSAHLYFRRESVRETLRVTPGRVPSANGAASPANPNSSPGASSRERVTSTQEDGRRRSASLSFALTPKEVIRTGGPCRETDARLAGLKALVEKMVEVLTGKKIRIRLVSWPPGMGVAFAGSGGGPARVGSPVLEYRYTRQLVEEERTVYAVSGKVVTADGREVSFNLILSMERDRVESESVFLRMGGEPVDPLVVVLDGSYARLSGQEVVFDLDLDGVSDRVPVPAPGSGFLFLDLDGDGRVSQGGELFGPRTGNGFSELSLHDLDGNGWIDEADPIFRDLRVWVWDGGEGMSYSLPELNIGALYVRSQETPFSLSSANDRRERGRISCTSFWLGEDGTTGVVQHLDLFL